MPIILLKPILPSVQTNVVDIDEYLKQSAATQREQWEQRIEGYFKEGLWI